METTRVVDHDNKAGEYIFMRVAAANRLSVSFMQAKSNDQTSI